MYIIPSFTQSMSPDVVLPKVISPRISGLGVPFTSLEGGVDTLFTNPACFSHNKKRWSASRLGVSITEDSSYFFNIFSEKDKIKTFPTSLFQNKNINLNCGVTGPLALAILGKNFGAGIFNRTILMANEDGSKDNFLLGEELFLTGGYGGSVFDDGTNNVSLGIQMKGVFQTFSYNTSTNTKTLSELPLVLSNGIGADLGFLYKYDNLFSFGITCRDAYTAFFCTQYNTFDDYKNAKTAGKTKYKYIIPNLSIGISSMPICNDTWETISSWAFYMDYQNIIEPILNKERNAILNLAIGTEIIFHKVLSFRLGLNECYPHFGCGLDFTYFQFDISAYAYENGNTPWQKPIVTIDAALSFEY